nr:M28 family peptidase [Chitinophaga nivalis]
MYVSAQKKNDRKILSNLQLHVSYLSSDKLEGRRSGAPGEQLAAAYIATQMQQLGLTPKGDNDFLQPFLIRESREPAASCSFTLNQVPLTLGSQYIPLPFSAAGSAKGEVLPHVNEPDNIWLVNIAELDIDNKKSMLEEYLKQTQIAEKSGATGVIFYNGKESAATVLQWLDHNLPPTGIPAVWADQAISKKLDDEEASSFQINIQLAFNQVKRTGTNVVGYLDNKAPKTVVIGAHYDHLGFGEETHAATKTLHPGANDNASGIAAMLEIARFLKSARLQHNNYIFVAFSGNEQGLFGSKYFTSRQNLDLSTINYMINMDMIGRLDNAKGLQIGGIGTSPGWPGILTAVTDKATHLVYDSSGVGPSDHTSFYRKNIPVLYFFTGNHSDSRQTGDSADTINYEGTLSIVKLICDIVSKTNNQEKLVFSSTREPQVTARK